MPRRCHARHHCNRLGDHHSRQVTVPCLCELSSVAAFLLHTLQSMCVWGQGQAYQNQPEARGTALLDSSRTRAYSTSLSIPPTAFPAPLPQVRVRFSLLLNPAILSVHSKIYRLSLSYQVDDNLDSYLNGNHFSAVSVNNPVDSVLFPPRVSDRVCTGIRHPSRGVKGSEEPREHLQETPAQGGRDTPSAADPPGHGRSPRLPHLTSVPAVRPPPCSSGSVTPISTFLLF